MDRRDGRGAVCDGHQHNGSQPDNDQHSEHDNGRPTQQGLTGRGQ